MKTILNIADDPALMKILTLIHDRKGFDFSQYKEGTLLRRIESRFRQLGKTSLDEYVNILADDPGEMSELIDSLCINVTDFFRNPESFEAIDKVVIPRVIYSKKEKSHKTIKAWSCGCSLGDEPYSLAMLLLEKLGTASNKFTINVIGTDIDERTLKEAGDVLYSDDKLNAVAPGIKDKYFTRVENLGHRLNENVKKLVKFRHHDVIKDAPILHCDIILCRNLLIYFNKQLQEEILLKFYECLEPGGYLVLGMVESLVGNAINRFENVDNRLRIYRRPEWVTDEQSLAEVLSQDDIDKIVREMLK